MTTAICRIATPMGAGAIQPICTEISFTTLMPMRSSSARLSSLVRITISVVVVCVTGTWSMNPSCLPRLSSAATLECILTRRPAFVSEISEMAADCCRVSSAVSLTRIRPSLMVTISRRSANAILASSTAMRSAVIPRRCERSRCPSLIARLTSAFFSNRLAWACAVFGL